MCCGQATPESQTHVTTTSTTKAYVWLTPWMPAIGVDTVKAVRKNHAVDGSIETFVAIQTASVRTDSPNAPAVIGTALNGDGEVCSGSVSVTSHTASVYYVRFGVAYALPSGGSGLGQADVAFSPAPALSGSWCSARRARARRTPLDGVPWRRPGGVQERS